MLIHMASKPNAALPEALLPQLAQGNDLKTHIKASKFDFWLLVAHSW
jgi:hypothetical protein